MLNQLIVEAIKSPFLNEIFSVLIGTVAGSLIALTYARRAERTRLIEERYFKLELDIEANIIEQEDALENIKMYIKKENVRLLARELDRLETLKYEFNLLMRLLNNDNEELQLKIENSIELIEDTLNKFNKKHYDNCNNILYDLNEIERNICEIKEELKKRLQHKNVFSLVTR